ncbi:alpha-L-iduronidase [Nephila pilipes]|uniref:Alpha-L-iduronidase n=1 Tax=Nephila pilipes TaxID=299642 RepID=A0A8X6TII8_NEPPI|nr:alpha-L-iduronidase [Nephila pilipes]
MNLFHIGSLPHNGISQVRIHWMLDLVQMRFPSDFKIAYDFNYLDELVHILWENDLRPGFELMGNPSGYFTDFENSTQVYMWEDLIYNLASHYIGFLNYYDACSEGLYRADSRLRFGGPGGSCRIPTVGKSPICWALLEHCVRGKNYFTGKEGVRLDFISFHKKGNASSDLILSEEIETIQYIVSRFPSLVNSSFYNDEADPLKNWSLPQWWRADSTYAAMVVKIILRHIYFYYVEKGTESIKNVNFDLLSNDNAFLSYFPNQFTERTLLARFQVNNTSPKYVEFVKKPVYAVFGLLSKMCPSVLSINLIRDGELLTNWGNNFGVIATRCVFQRETVIILYNSADTLPNSTDVHVNIALNIPESNGITKAKWSILEVNNKNTNPYLEWKYLGMPSYPSIKEFSLIKDSEKVSDGSNPLAVLVKRGNKQVCTCTALSSLTCQNSPLSHRSPPASVPASAALLKPRHPASQRSVKRSSKDFEAMLHAWVIDNDTKYLAIGCYFVQLRKNSSFHRTMKRPTYKALFGTEPKLGLQYSHISEESLEKLITEEDLDLLLNQLGDDFILTLVRHLPVAFSEDDNDTLTLKDLSACELIDYNASTSNYLTIVKSTNNNTSMLYDLSVADLVTKKVFNLEDLPEIELISLSTRRQLELVNNYTSTSASTVKTFIELFASEGEATVSDSKACYIVCQMGSTGAHLRGILKNPVHAICGKTVGEEGYASKIL